tara:strand:- start:639 stop:863 length:225 start_codon:yes stop_codon:yes gene_type:complete
MNQQFLDTINRLIELLEVAQRRGAFTLTEASTIVNTINDLKNMLIASEQVVQQSTEDVESVDDIEDTESVDGAK